MSFFKKIFSTDPSALESKADQQFEAGEYGGAKLTYEKAREAYGGDIPEELGAKIDRCKDGIAAQRIAEAKRQLQGGAIEFAAQELLGALEVAVDPGVREEAQSLIDQLEGDEAKQRAVSHETSDEERLALIIGQWEEAQAQELEAHGERLFQALIDFQNERFEQARATLETLLGEAQTPRYLWLELGKARLLADDVDGAEQALTQFVTALEQGEGGEHRLAAHLALARIADDRGAFDRAMTHFAAAVEAMPNDYRPYLAMGSFLRDKGHGAEALEVLQSALEICTVTSHVDWLLLQELGLTQQMEDNPEEAVSFFEQVLEFFTSHQITDYPVPTATSLARLYEKSGRLERAADLYRGLSQGSDTGQHARYHYEAGRLLGQLGLHEESRRMLTRARALAAQSEDAGLGAEVDALLQVPENEPLSP